MVFNFNFYCVTTNTHYWSARLRTLFTFVVDSLLSPLMTDENFKTYTVPLSNNMSVLFYPLPGEYQITLEYIDHVQITTGTVSFS